MTRLDIGMAMVDCLERVATPQEYYRLNHASQKKILLLGEAIAAWLVSVGVEVSESSCQ